MFGRLSHYARALRVAIVVVIGARVLLSTGSASADPAEAKKIFTTRCMACHTFGKGVKVGPDLKGVNDRRKRPWLVQFVRASSAVIAAGDPIATALLDEFKQQRMPDWSDLSETQVGDILDWLAANGPDQQDDDQRAAASATLAEIEIGRRLFHGSEPLSLGGIACASCHSIKDGGSVTGGTLAPELTEVYSRYQDGAITQALRHPCVRRLPESAQPAFLTSKESFTLKAYLREASLTDPSATGHRDAIVVAKTVEAAGGDSAAPPPPGAAPDKVSPTAAAKRVVWVPKLAAPAPRIGRGAPLGGELLFRVFPYVALVMLVIGMAVRFGLARRRPEAIRGEASSAWQAFSGSRAWRIGAVVSIALHVIALVVPRAVVAWDAAPVRLYLLEAAGFVFGVALLAGWARMMWQLIRGAAWSDNRPAEIADCVLLSVIGAGVVSGLLTALTHRWGSVWSASTLTPYIASLLHGAPATDLIEQMPFLVRLHVFSWFALLALLPFTSAAMIGVSISERVLLLAARPLHAVAGAGRRTLTRLSPARWLWPEED